MKNKRLLILPFFFLSISIFAQDNKDVYPFQNPELSLDSRVEDLVSRLTLQEKIAQMQNNAPSVERLGIPAYNWWNECLHGVARTDSKVTVFPQAIAMAATFDVPSMHRTGEIISTEARAIYNETIRIAGKDLQYRGLTFWTPNINIFRDPRWGRGQETYGEDPYLTGEIGKAMVGGLQGDDPLLLKASACAKHFAVHSGPEHSRHTFNAIVDEYDLWDTYLPAFRSLVVEAKVSSVMGAYNAFRGQTFCASDKLNLQILHDFWKFDGYYTSDCGAIFDFYRNHNTHSDAAEASADAVRHKTDLECGTEYAHLLEAVERGYITEKEIDESVSELFRIRFRLGLFDPADRNPYSGIPYTVLESPEHQAHALKMAHESMVLLKNDGILPLKNNIRKIAVLGPNADNPEIQLGNYNGFPSEIVTPLEAIRERTGAEVEYLAASTYFSGHDDWAKIDAVVNDADLVIFVGGISPRLEGEEGDASGAEGSGFDRGDRTTILLPAVQTEVMKHVKAMDKALVFVSMSGSALAFPWESEHADAILQAWYGGQAAGNAVADILWGDYNPSGRLPVTFYADDSQLPPFDNYEMAGRTYRYFEGKPAYPFGFGLSYTEFSYSAPELEKSTVRTGEPVKVQVSVRNSGRVAGDEVVQLYLSYPDAPAPKPNKALKGFKRIHLMPGEEQIVQFELSPRDLSLVGTDGISRCLAGKVKVTVGGCSDLGSAVADQTAELKIKGRSLELPR